MNAEHELRWRLDDVDAALTSRLAWATLDARDFVRRVRALCREVDDLREFAAKRVMAEDELLVDVRQAHEDDVRGEAPAESGE